jgi:DNA-binding transcriptional MerR regulator/uncharacterized glyoxalase superfamily protein PhnB
MAVDGRSETGRKVGDLAAAAGVTVRTLHHYEEIGLLAASGRTDSGHRIYSDADVERLYRISLLRRLGFQLGEIGQALDDPAWSLRSAVSKHLSDLERRIDAETSLRSRLLRLGASMGTTDDLPADELLALLEEMSMLDTAVQRRISILVYADIETAFTYLIEVFGLGPGELFHDEAGEVVHGEVQAGDGVIWLHPERPAFNLASPRTVGASTAMMAVMVDDVDAHFRYAKKRGAPIRYEPVDQPYGYREYSALDSEGRLWSFMKSLN